MIAVKMLSVTICRGNKAHTAICKRVTALTADRKPMRTDCISNNFFACKTDYFAYNEVIIMLDVIV